MKFKSLITLLVIITAIATFSTPALAGKPECGLVGSWTGYAGPIAWTASHTANDKAGNEGTMQMDWFYADPGLLTWYNHYPVSRLTQGNGVWKKVGNKYDYTWYAFGVGADGYPVYTVRISGTAEMSDCDTVSIIYAYELFEGIIFSKDMPSKTAARSTTGEAVEYRNLLFQWPELP